VGAHLTFGRNFNAMNTSVTDAALKAVYSAEADEYRRQSRKWFISSQIFMLLAGSPLVLAVIGSVVSFFSGSENSLAWAGFSFFGGVIATFVTMIIFCPFAFYCIYRFYKSRKSIGALVGDTVRQTDAEQFAAGNRP
jgi:prolipoprotein diacylglyceryltransferase